MSKDIQQSDQMIQSKAMHKINRKFSKIRSATLWSLLVCNIGIGQEVEASDDVPVLTITREQIENVEVENVGQLIKFMSAKLPMPEGGTPHQSIKEQILQTDNKIAEDSGDYILVQSYVKNKATDTMEASFQTKYYFKDGLLTRGPVLVEPAATE